MESPEMHSSLGMQTYIAQEVTRPCKQWIHEVLSAQRETERVKLRTDHFVLLPDVDTSPHQVFSRLILDKNAAEPWAPPMTAASPPGGDTQRDVLTHTHRKGCHTGHVTAAAQRPPSQPPPCNSWLQPLERRWRGRKPLSAFHWLAVVTDTSLRTLRDLRGGHIEMLISLYTQSCQKIHEDTGTPRDQVMAYVHYPPSVYQLHIHFKHPVGPHFSHDSFRIHPLVTIINNLKIDSDYYAKSILQLPVYPNTELYTALGGKGGDHYKQRKFQIQACASDPGEAGAIEPIPGCPDKI